MNKNSSMLLMWAITSIFIFSVACFASQIMPLTSEEVTKILNGNMTFMTSKMKSKEMKEMHSRSEEGQKIFRSIPFRVAKEMGYDLAASLNQYFLRANKEDLTGEEGAALIMLCGALGVDIDKNNNSLQAINRLSSDGLISDETKLAWEKFLGTAVVPDPVSKPIDLNDPKYAKLDSRNRKDEEAPPRAEPVVPPYVGLNMSPLSHENVNGVLITAVNQSAPGGKAGLQANDLIQSIDGKPMKTPEDVQEYVGMKKVGDSIEFRILRDNGEKSIPVKLEPRP